jgi:hypothetical protein
VTGLPPEAAAGQSAFTPHFTRLAASGAQAYKDGVTGHPGTTGIPAPTRDTVPSPDRGDQILYGSSSSRLAPDMIWPNQYYARPEASYYPGAGMPVQIYNPVRPQDTTMIPVPAVSLAGYYRQQSAALAAGVAPGGQKALREWPKLIRWPQRRKGGGQPGG